MKGKRVDESDMQIIVGVSDKTYYNSEDEFNNAVENWMEMILNKYGNSIEVEN